MWEYDGEVASGVWLAAEDGSVRDRISPELSLLLSQPVVDDRDVFVAADVQEGNRLFGFHDGESEAAWSVEVGRGFPFRPTLSYADETIYRFDHADRAFEARDPDSGDQLWSEPISLPTRDQWRSSLISPVVEQDVLVAAGDRDTASVRLDAPTIAAERESGEKRWRFEAPPMPIDSDNEDIPEEVQLTYGHPLLFDEFAIVAGTGQPADDEPGHHVFGIDRSDGSLAWHQETEAGSMAPVAAGDVVYVPTNGELLVLSPDGELLDSVAGEQFVSTFEHSPAIGGGKLLVSGINHVVAFS